MGLDAGEPVGHREIQHLTGPGAECGQGAGGPHICLFLRGKAGLNFRTAERVVANIVLGFRCKAVAFVC